MKLIASSILSSIFIFSSSVYSETEPKNKAPGSFTNGSTDPLVPIIRDPLAPLCPSDCSQDLEFSASGTILSVKFNWDNRFSLSSIGNGMTFAVDSGSSRGTFATVFLDIEESCAIDRTNSLTTIASMKRLVQNEIDRESNIFGEIHDIHIDEGFADNKLGFAADFFIGDYQRRRIIKYSTEPNSTSDHCYYMQVDTIINDPIVHGGLVHGLIHQLMESVKIEN
ncbi:hypothetical protein [Pseudobacteriovorax antillogorgiicola]|uniref:Uncharacterized protein n=1 Tax=Pseudobacteriovorax antillogorgiicola TaxID=1513793 RepID=A0A1Y6CL81_9BACT|nr:hypothetical protein [Pseudobacteriovorax antillogorgiicola]TCS45874.1 hypothetical protein EDD56_12637 [Pseudobacteriovorax antillogorgiicola]SMF71271.1 hypothetical protein SAMN06296036_12661 [Pseudobacteriovorax antillogorgiicola]